MTATPLDRQKIAHVDPKKEYRALLRSLKFRQGFELLFVQCSPAEGERLIAEVRRDLPQKRIEVLSLTEPIETLYDKVEVLYRSQHIDVLFVQGIEHSLYDYEKTRLWSDDAQRRSYSETGIPRLLQHLNLSRERFHEDFKIHFVFLVPHFVLKYLVRRAPDFFDWNSGVLEFVMERDLLRQESEQAQTERFIRDDSQQLTPEECQKSLLRIQSLIEEPNQTNENTANLLFEQARLLEISGEEEAAIASYDKALQIKPDDDLVWFFRGNILDKLGRHEEAITSYDEALKTDPGKDVVWNNRGVALFNLGRYEDAIASYDKALQFKPDDPGFLGNRSIALSNLEFFKTYEDAIASYDKALQIKPDNPTTFYNKACCHAAQANVEGAIENLSRAIALAPDQYREMAKTDLDFDSIRENERFQALVFG
jgi:tetratricopeptide (TPR) repeat protein